MEHNVKIIYHSRNICNNQALTSVYWRQDVGEGVWNMSLMGTPINIPKAWVISSKKWSQYDTHLMNYMR